VRILWFVFLFFSASALEREHTGKEPACSDEICAICLEPIDLIQSRQHCIVVGHPFHKDCLVRWGKDTCPTCRGRIIFRFIKSPEDILPLWRSIRKDSSRDDCETRQICEEILAYFRDVPNVLSFCEQRQKIIDGIRFELACRLKSVDGLARAKSLYEALISDCVDDKICHLSLFNLADWFRRNPAYQTRARELYEQILRCAGVRDDVIVEAKYYLACMLKNGDGGAKDKDRARVLFMQLRDDGRAVEFRQRVTDKLIEILAHSKDKESGEWGRALCAELIDTYPSSSHSTRASAMLILAKMHYEGVGGECDLVRSRLLYEELVDSGLVSQRVKDSARLKLAEMLRDGEGGERNLLGAHKIFQDIGERHVDIDIRASAKIDAANVLSLLSEQSLRQVTEMENVGEIVLERARDCLKRSHDMISVDTQTDGIFDRSLIDREDVVEPVRKIARIG